MLYTQPGTGLMVGLSPQLSRCFVISMLGLLWMLLTVCVLVRSIPGAKPTRSFDSRTVGLLFSSSRRRTLSFSEVLVWIGYGLTRLRLFHKWRGTFSTPVSIRHGLNAGLQRLRRAITGSTRSSTDGHS